MMTRDEILSTYETLERITGDMLSAARNAQWDSLVELEQSCTAHVTRLREGGDVALGPEGRQRKMELIKKILDADRHIRDLTTPWLAQLSAMINNTTTRRRLANAYGDV
ncbi:flagellar protein FliT [Massilia sp. LXY-6]|uniref:flagellar protein FliT n=1 Tax=Massilia sp. LXY-6 TaxID=3379823 RepID=UPI003EE010A0